MSKNLVSKVGTCSQDNLIAGLYPPAMTTGVKIAAQAGKLVRGTVLASKGDGTYEVMNTGKTPAYILAEDVDASGSETVAAVAYRSGNFNPAAVLVDSGYNSGKLAAEDKDTLRKYGIIFTHMLQD